MRDTRAEHAGEQLIYETAKEQPIYLGNFEMSHKGCPFVSIAKQIDQEIEMNVRPCYGRSEKGLHRVRFFLNRQMARPEAETMRSITGIPGVSRLVIWVDGITQCEVQCEEPVLDTIVPVTRETFGDILGYRADFEMERFGLISPSSLKTDGKERLFQMEEQMKGFGDVELISFRRLIVEDLEHIFQSMTDNNLPDRWISPEDVNILDKAYQMGYFEIPRKCEQKDLAEKLNMPVTTLNARFRSINKAITERFLEKARQSLPP